VNRALQMDWLGVPIRVLHPELLWLAAVSTVIGLMWALRSARRARLLHRLIDPHAVPRALVGRSPSRTAVRGSALTLGLLLLSVALAQPQCGTSTELTKRTGIDVVVALDASRSMLAEDIRPSRLERAKLELADLLDRLRGDRVAIVVFAADAFVQCPLTTDYAAAKLFLHAIDVNSVPQQGTSLSSALLTAKQVLDDGGGVARGRAVVLLTDGEDHEAGIGEALDQLNAESIRVYPVGIGSATGEPIPTFDDKGRFGGYKRDKLGQTVMTRLNEDALREIATKTGGRYFHSTAGDVGVPAVYEELERLDKAEFESHLTVQYAERYRDFAMPGLFLLLIGAGLTERRRREPESEVPA
jgi:Ca-activated chloride channel family protein